MGLLNSFHGVIVVVVFFSKGAGVAVLSPLKVISSSSNGLTLLVSKTFLNGLNIFPTFVLLFRDPLAVSSIKICYLLGVIRVKFAGSLVVLILHGGDFVASIRLYLTKMFCTLLLHIHNELPVLVLQFSLLLAEVLLHVTNLVGVTVFGFT